MNCLCCGKELPQNATDAAWHVSCIRHFFDTASLPEICLTEEQLLVLAKQAVAVGHTVTGVQKKLSLHLEGGSMPRLTLLNYPAGYILKPQTEEYPYMPEAEHLVMSMADAAGLCTVPHALIRQENRLAYICRRIDRKQEKDGSIHRLAMEDFCQLDGKPTEEKYLGSYERCAKIIKRYSEHSGLDLSEFYMRLIFCFLTGNSDMHLKNFSLLETKEGSGHYTLSPAYDLLPVQLFLTKDMEDTALTLNGKKQHLTRKDWLCFAENIGIPSPAALRMNRHLLAMLPQWSSMCEASLLPEPLQKNFLDILAERSRRLSG